MKLASLKAGGRDGRLIVVDRALKTATQVDEIAASLQAALEEWPALAPRLTAIYAALNSGERSGFSLDFAALAAPLPRAYQWLDGSAYLSHVERVRKARSAEMPPKYLSDPLMYQGNSAHFLGPCDPIAVADLSAGVDFEAELAVVTDDVPAGVTTQAARAHIKLLMLVNDVSLRELIPAELAKGFGFLHGKPGCAFAPVAVTPDELGSHWDGGRLHLPLLTYRNGVLFGQPNAGEDMQFDFPALIAHAARTRRLPAGTIIGSGTVSNADQTRGCSCIVERRVIEILETGLAATPYMGYGERVRIEMLDTEGRSVFGAIEQPIVPCRI